MTDTNPATPATPANPGIAPALVLDHVSVSFGDGDSTVHALDDVSHGVESGNGTAGPVGAPDFTPATVSDAQWYLDGWNMG